MSLVHYESDPGAPSPDIGTVKALRRLDPNLKAIWRFHWINRLTGGDLKTSKGDPIPYPRWHIVLRTPDTWTHLFAVEDEQGNAMPLDHRVIRRIESDIARWKTAQEINAEYDRRAQEHKEKRETRFDDLRFEALKANKTKISEVFEGDNIKKGPSTNTRDARIFSYTGQPNRRTSTDSIPTTPEEEGWEWPDVKKEMA